MIYHEGNRIIKIWLFNFLGGPGFASNNICEREKEGERENKNILKCLSSASPPAALIIPLFTLRLWKLFLRLTQCCS